MSNCVCPDCECNHEVMEFDADVVSETAAIMAGYELDDIEKKPYGILRLRMCEDCLKGRHGIARAFFSSLEILKRRFANGEISEDEFLRKKELLSDF